MRSPKSIELKPREHFETFANAVDHLSGRRIFQTGLSSGFTVSFTKDSPMTYKSEGPDEEDLRSYLLDFRKFVSKREPVYIRRIHNLCHQHFDSEELKDRIKDCQDGWKNHVLRSGISLIVNGKKMEPEHIVDLWINGHYFHGDTNKLKELQRYPAPISLFLREEFMNFVINATRVIGATGFIVKKALVDGSVKC